MQPLKFSYAVGHIDCQTTCYFARPLIKNIPLRKRMLQPCTTQRLQQQPQKYSEQLLNGRIRTKHAISSITTSMGAGLTEITKINIFQSSFSQYKEWIYHNILSRRVFRTTLFIISKRRLSSFPLFIFLVSLWGNVLIPADTVNKYTKTHCRINKINAVRTRVRSAFHISQQKKN